MPNISSNLCLLRISDTDNLEINDESDDTFSIYKEIFLVPTRDGVFEVSQDSTIKKVIERTYCTNDIIETTVDSIFTFSYKFDGIKINVFDLSYQIIGTINIPDEVQNLSNFVILPDLY